MNKINSLEDIRKEFMRNNGYVCIVNKGGKIAGIEFIYSQKDNVLEICDTIYSDYFKEIISCNPDISFPEYRTIYSVWEYLVEPEIKDYLKSYRIKLSSDRLNFLSFRNIF